MLGSFVSGFHTYSGSAKYVWIHVGTRNLWQWSESWMKSTDGVLRADGN